jgi:hypothetical protein
MQYPFTPCLTDRFTYKNFKVLPEDLRNLPSIVLDIKNKFAAAKNRTNLLKTQK